MKPSLFALFTAFSVIVLAPVQAASQSFSGGGVSIYGGTGWPNTIDAATELATDLGINDETGNFTFGIQGFYQGEDFRLGGVFQGHGWAGFDNGTGDDDVAGVGAAIGGLYATWTIKHDRVLLNAGGIVGAGRCMLGYNLESENEDQHSSVSTFYLEPQVSVGVATCRWFGVEFQLSAPIFILTDDLTFVDAGNTYTVESSEMDGVNFSIKLTFGRIADL